MKMAMEKVGGMLNGMGNDAIGEMMNKVVSATGIQVMAVQNLCFRVIVYINISVAFLLALFSFIINVIFINTGTNKSKGH